MTVEVVVPGFGESISTVVLVEWLKKVGDQVKAGDDLVEVESAYKWNGNEYTRGLGLARVEG